jgi:hypothetical protein
MTITIETSLEDFKAWSGGADTLNTLIEKDLCDKLEQILEYDIFPNGCEDTELNDFLWFEDDYIAELLGFRDWEDLENDGEDEDEEIDMELLEKSINNSNSFDVYCDSADCDTCPFDAKCKGKDECEFAYNKMLDGYSFEDAIDTI